VRALLLRVPLPGGKALENPHSFYEQSNETGEEEHFIAHALYSGRVLPIVPAVRERRWMDESLNHAAYRCLPLSIANQHGWHILGNQKLRIVWNGSRQPSGIKIEVLEGQNEQCWAITNFGDGIVTWMIPYLFQTPKGYNLLARGPANMPKDGVSALEGIIETDWAYTTFTMNWKLTRAHHPVEFAVGEPICVIVPQPRAMLERLKPLVKELDSQSSLGQAYHTWADDRVKFREETAKVDDGRLAQTKLWQKDYFFGKDDDGTYVGGHQTKYRLRRFAIDLSLLQDKRQADALLTWGVESE
jgi:hypothetical protein